MFKRDDFMKKRTAIIILVIGAIIAQTLLWFGGFWLCLLFELTFVLELSIIVIMLAATFGIDCLRRFFARKYSLTTGWFMLCAYAPAAAWVIPSLIKTINNRNSKYNFMAGIARGYEQEYTPAAAAALVGGALLWLGIFSVAAKRRSKT